MSPTIERTFSGCRGAVGQVQHVVEELVLVVPQADASVLADVAHRLGDVQEVLEELGRDVLVDVVVLRQLQRDAHQIQRVHRHPAGAVRLVDVAAGGQLALRSKTPMLSRPRKPP